MRGTAYGLETPRDERDWRTRAACRDYDPEMWSVFGTKLTRDNRLAIRICNNLCPVSEECEKYAKRVGLIGVIAAGEPCNTPLRLHVPARAHGGKS